MISYAYVHDIYMYSYTRMGMHPQIELLLYLMHMYVYDIL